MPEIITITFSPCIDKSTSIEALIAEKKIKCRVPKLEPGGGGINVARAITKLGGKATAIYPAGGYTGKFLNELVQKENVPAIVIETKNETRENIIVLDESTNQQYRFGMPGTILEENDYQKILQAIEETEHIKFIIASGSLPPGAPLDIFARIAIIARKKKAKLIVDTSGEALKDATDEGVFLIKPNLGELSVLAGKDYLEPNEISIAAKKIINAGKCEVVVVSMGSEGAMLVAEGIERNIVSPQVKRKSTVGAGDSMVAGIVLALSNGNDLETAVHYGVACGTAATMNPGTELCRKEDAEKLFNILTTGSVKNRLLNSYQQ